MTHAIGVERMRFTKYGEFTVGCTFVKDFNRYFRDDVVNVNVALGYRFVP